MPRRRLDRSTYGAPFHGETPPLHTYGFSTGFTSIARPKACWDQTPGLTGAPAAVEGGRVVVLHRGPIVGSVGVHQAHPPDRERHLVETAEDAGDRLATSACTTRRPMCGLPVEPPVPQPDQAELAERHRTPGMPRDAVHPRTDAVGQPRDRRDVLGTGVPPTDGRRRTRPADQDRDREDGRGGLGARGPAYPPPAQRH